MIGQLFGCLKEIAIQGHPLERRCVAWKLGRLLEMAQNLGLHNRVQGFYV